MDQECYLKILPSKITSFEDITTIDILLTEAILKLQKANEKNSFIQLLMDETIKIVSGAVTLLQSYQLSFSIDSLISKVTDILMLANDSSKDAKVIVVKSLTENFIDLLICQAFKLLHKLEILKTLNIVLQSCPVTAKQKLLINSAFAAKLKLLVKSLEDVGDYEFQVCIIELFFRLVPKDQRANFMEKSFNDEIFRSELLNIRDSRFETDCRYFLNKQNAKAKKNFNRIYTIPAICVKIDGTKLYRPSDEGYDEFWVDFNTGSKRVGIFCEPNFLSSQQTQDDELWETLSIWSRDVKTFSYSAKNKLKTATIEILPGAQLLGSRRDGQSHLVVISVSQEYELQKALESTFKNELKASAVDEPIKINVRKQQNSIVDKALTDISSSSITSSFTKSKVSIPINRMTTPAHSVIASDYDISPAIQLMNKKINQDIPSQLQVKSNLQPPDKEKTNKLQSENELMHCNQSIGIDTSNNKKACISTTPKKTPKSIKKTKTPIVFVNPEVKRSNEIFNKKNISDKMDEQKPVNKVEKEVLPLPDNQSKNQDLKNKTAHTSMTVSKEPATEQKGKYKRNKEAKLKTSKFNEIKVNNIAKNRRKTISPGNISLDDFNLKKPCKTTLPKSQDQYAMSKKQQHNKTDLPSKASEKYKNKEKKNTEIDIYSKWKDFPPDNEAFNKNNDQVEKNFKVRNNTLNSENDNDESQHCKKIQDQYALSKKQQHNKTDMPSKASEKYKNKEKKNTEIDIYSKWKDFRPDNEAFNKKNDQVEKSFKVRNNKLNSENDNDESPKTCTNSGFSQFIDFGGKSNQSKKDSDDIIAETPTASNLISNADAKKKTESSSHLMQEDKKLLNQNNKTKNLFCNNVCKMQDTESNNVTNTAEFPPEADVHNSFIFKKSEIPKDKDSPYYLDKSQKQKKKDVTSQKNDIKNIDKPVHNLRERKKAISYKKEQRSFSAQENKTRIKKLKQKPIDIKKTAFKPMKDCISSQNSPRTNYSYKKTQKETNNYVSLASGKKEKKPIYQGLWTSQKVEKTVTTMSFSGHLPQDMSSDPYDFDLECSAMSGRSSLLPFHCNEITESSQKSVQIRNKKSLKQINKIDKKNKTIKNCVNSKSNHSKATHKAHLSTAQNKSTKNVPLKEQVKKKINDTDIGLLTPAYIVKTHELESDSESSKSPLVDNSEKEHFQNQGLVFPHLEDSIPCTPCPDHQDSPDPSLSFTLPTTGSEVSWIRRPVNENQTKHVKTYETKNHKVSPIIETPEHKNQLKDSNHLYKKIENNSMYNRLDQNNKESSVNLSFVSKNSSKKVMDTVRPQQSSSSLFQNLYPPEPQNEVDEKTWSIISSQLNSHIKDALNKGKPLLNEFVSPLDVTSNVKSGPSSTRRPTKSALKRKYSNISSDSSNVASDMELNELPDDMMNVSLKLKPKKLFKTDHSPIHSECTSQEKSVSETSNIEEAPKKKTLTDNRNMNILAKPKAPSSFSMQNEKETETGKSFVGFKFFPTYTQSPEIVRHNKMGDELLSEELGLSPLALSEISSLNLSGDSPLTSKVMSKFKEPKQTLNKTEKGTKHSLAKVSKRGSELSKLELNDECQVNQSDRCFQESVARKKIKKLPKNDDEDFQNILSSTCKFLHSKWDSEQNENVMAVDKFQDLVQTCVTNMNVHLEELAKTEKNVSVLWEQARENFKKHRLSQRTELKRLMLAQKALEQSLFQTQHCEKSGQKKFLTALKKDMDAIQKKILFQINENSLKAIRQCLQHSAMLS